jgi:dUTP pyrophosphatase
MTVNVKFAKVRPGAIIPVKGDDGNMCFDFFACFDEDFVEIKPGEVKLVPTGIATAFDDDFGLVFRERGSTGKINLKINSGVIDSNFRGEIFAALYNGNIDKSIFISKFGETGEQSPLAEHPDAILYPYNKAVCQGMFLPVPKVDFEVISFEELSAIDSARGNGCLGSSGR